MNERQVLCDCVCAHCQRAGYHWIEECGYGSGVNRLATSAATSEEEQR